MTVDEAAELKSKKKEKEELETKLKGLLDSSKRQQKYRATKKETLAKIVETHPELKNQLQSQTRGKIGRPSLEVEQPDLLRAIIEIAKYGSAAHERRNSDVYRTCKTLDELTAALKRDSRSFFFECR